MNHLIFATRPMKYSVLTYREDTELGKVKSLAPDPASRQSQCWGWNTLSDSRGLKAGESVPFSGSHFHISVNHRS